MTINKKFEIRGHFFREVEENGKIRYETSKDDVIYATCYPQIFKEALNIFHNPPPKPKRVYNRKGKLEDSFYELIR